MGGVDLWQNEDESYDNFDPQSMHDKILEVVSISGTWHLGKLQVIIINSLARHFSWTSLWYLICGLDDFDWHDNFHLFKVGLSRARRLAQGQSIKIHVLAPLPVQVDGEPWVQQPCTINISHHGQVRLSFFKLFPQLTKKFEYYIAIVHTHKSTNKNNTSFYLTMWVRLHNHSPSL